MSFSPIIPLTGPGGWAFLKRTEALQSSTFQRQASVQRDEAYFRERIGGIATAQDLVSDRRLLRITLEAFGLEQDLNARAFIRKVLEGGTLKPESLANRLTDSRYRDLSAAFGFGDFSIPRNRISDFADGILARWRDRRFEAAVGTVDNSMRLALNARRELPLIAASERSEDTKWFRVLGNRPIWTVMQGALGLPRTFGGMDIDRQLSAVKERAGAIFGADSVSQFRNPEKIETMIRRFLATSQESGLSGFQNPAVTLLQQTSLMRRL